MDVEKKVCKEIGNQLRNLRINNGYTSYESFAMDHELSRMQYWRIEKGLTNLTIRSLIKLLNIHKVSIEDFFQTLNQPDGKVKIRRNNGRKPNRHSRNARR
jgi:transcriptional regulator with XRE-family HTH domain